MMDDFQETIRSFASLGGQHAPRAGDGVGIKLLYRCNLCQRIWLQDGQRITLNVSDAQAKALAQELSADLTRLPGSTCRLCLYQTGGGATEIDEYGTGVGFGFSWECPAPRIIHAMATITSLDWLRCTPLSHQLPDVVTRPDIMRAVLAWFVEQLSPPHLRPLPTDLLARLTATNPPGFKQTGTADWHWCGGFGELPCPPLGTRALVILAIAMPRSAVFSLPAFFPLWQSLALCTLLGSVAGETRPDFSPE